MLDSFFAARRGRGFTRSMFGLLALGFLALGCSEAGPEESFRAGDYARDGEEGVTDVGHTPVKTQAISNCWLYATAGWAEALHARVQGSQIDISETYWTYWDLFEKIVSGSGDGGELSTYGSISRGADLIDKYGFMLEQHFLPSEAGEPRSERQAAALATLRASLKSGALSDWRTRRDLNAVRGELDRAFGLPAQTIVMLDQVFGRSVDRNLRSAPGLMPSAMNIPVFRAEQLAIMQRDPHTGEWAQGSLRDALGTPAANGTRGGQLAWSAVSYPSESSARRTFQRAIQRALHDAQPVVVFWLVDTNAKDARGDFVAPPAFPGSQGGHMTLLEDYEIENVPGVGTLPAGQLEQRPWVLEAALSDEARIVFFRSKNSWGIPADDVGETAAGYVDLYLRYLDGPITTCEKNADGTMDASRCGPTVPWHGAYLPPGYLY